MLATVLLGALCLHGQVAQKKGPKRIFTHDRDVETAFQWTNVPRWDGEFLVGYINNRTSGPVIVTIDRDGRRQETLFTLKDAGQINLIDVAASPNGEIEAIGSALGGDRGATFLARISPDRKSQVTRVWPYCPMIVTFAPDGTVWTIGHLKDEANTHEIANHVLRRFDPSGKLLGSTTLNVRGDLTDETTYLRSSRDRVGWFNTRIGEYLEFSLDGVEMARYDGPGAAERDMTGVGLSPENDVVAGRFRKDKTELDMLDRETHTWVPVSIPPEVAPTYYTRVFGFDGTTLVTNHTATELRRFNTR